MALSQHYSLFHSIINKPHIHEAYTVTFAEQASFYFLDKCDHQLDTKINIQNMILPCVKIKILFKYGLKMCNACFLMQINSV